MLQVSDAARAALGEHGVGGWRRHGGGGQRNSSFWGGGGVGDVLQARSPGQIVRVCAVGANLEVSVASWLAGSPNHPIHPGGEDREVWLSQDACRATPGRSGRRRGRAQTPPSCNGSLPRLGGLELGRGGEI